MAMNMDAAIRIKANVQGGNAIQAFSRDLKGLDGAAKLSGAELGRMNIAINRMAREAGNTTAGLRQHIAALSTLRDRVDIGGKAYNRLGGEIEALRSKLRALDRDAIKTGSSLSDKLVSGLATVGIGRMTAGIIGNAAGLDAEVRKAAAIEGSRSYDMLRKSIEEVATIAAGTPTQVAQLATALSRAGFTAKETTQALEGIVMGAEAAGVSFEEMGSIAADAMRAFGIDTSKTTQVVDILLKTANSSNQTVLDLGESLKYAAPIARSLGVNINDLSATMAILANNGIRGSEAGTALRTGLGRLQLAASGSQDQLLDLTRGSALLGEAMTTLGANVLTAKGDLKPLDDVLVTLKGNLEKLPKGVQVEVMKALFGDEAGGKLRAALNSTEADIRKMFAAIRESGGATQTTHEQMRGFNYTMDVLTGNIETVTNAIGEKFIAVLDPLAKVAIGVLDVLLKMPQPLKDLAAWAAAAGIAVAGTVLAIKTVGGVTAIFTTLSAALTAATGAQTGFNLAVLANPYVAAAAGLVAITVAAYNMSKPFKEFVDSIPERFGMFWDSLANDASYAIGRVTQLWTDFTGFMGDVVTNIQASWQGFSNWFSGIWEGIKGFAVKALQKIGVDAGWLSDTMHTVANEVEYWWNSAFHLISTNWRSTVAGMINNTNPLYAALKGLGIADVGQATVGALFGPVQPAPAMRPVPRSNIIAAAPTGVGDAGLSGLGAGGTSSSSKTKFEPSSQARALIAAAQKLGVSPLDLATIIGFETGGTYSPSKWGGAGGKYMGLIQFGPNERRAYGASPGQSFEEQVLGPVVRYFEDRFKNQGMSTQGANLLTLYRTVLGGNPKANINKDDAFGTTPASGVARMGPHRAESLRRFFGGSMENVGYDAVNAATDRAQGYSEMYEKQQQALKDINALTKDLTQSNGDLGDKLRAVGLTGAEALGSQYDTAIKQIARETEDARNKVLALEKASGKANPELRSLVDRQDELKKGLAASQYVEGVKGLLPSLQDYDRQLAENNVLLGNKKKGLQDITEVQKLDLQLQMLGLDVLIAANPALQAQVDLLKQRAKALDDQRKALSDTSKAFGDTIKDKLQSYYNTVKDTAGQIGDAMTTAFQGLEDKLTDFVTTGKANFKELAQSILADLARVAIRAAIIKPLVGAIGGMFPGFTFANGGIMTSSGPLPLRTYANGGIANSPQLALYGEGRRPEAYVPLPDGRRIPVALQGGGQGGGATVNVSVDARGTSVRGDTGQSERLGRVVAQAVQQELIRQRRPGGILSAAT